MVDDRPEAITVEEMYGEWDYEAAVELLERSLHPRSSSVIFDAVASLEVGAEDVVLDIGGRDGRHALVMAERFGCRVVCVDPAPANIKAGIEAVTEHDFGHLVDIRSGTMEQIPAGTGEFNLVFSRDMMNHVADLDGGLAECRRVLVPGGHMVVHAVFATEQLEPGEAERLYAESAVVPERMSSESFEKVVESTRSPSRASTWSGPNGTKLLRRPGLLPTTHFRSPASAGPRRRSWRKSVSSPTGRCTEMLCGVTTC
jgi:ubiquinone/menaquinone biosynthesis C-methylase UbiE